jgi:dimethylaniline monooxygenase (N-oxide forming)
LLSYANHFDLTPCIRFSEGVDKVYRDESDQIWMVKTVNVKTGKEETHPFDKVVLATGILNTPKRIKVKGSEAFQGEIIHSREIKDPSKYRGKNVMVVGVGATGADTAVFLKQAGASNIYLSHRGQYFLVCCTCAQSLWPRAWLILLLLQLPRVFRGLGFDHAMNRRMLNMVRYIASYSPRLCAFIMTKGLVSAQGKALPFLKDHPSFTAPRAPPNLMERVPVFSDHLADYLRDGDVEAVPGVEQVCGPRSVRLTDGRQIDGIDAMILCTGYEYDFSMIEGKGDPIDPSFAPDGFDKIESAPFNTSKIRLPRLYRGILSERYPESLAILGHFLMMGSPFVVNDLVSMALASVWTGSYPMPTRKEMRADIDKHYNFVVSALQRGPLVAWGFRMDSRDTYAWMNRAAGTGINERLGSWGWKSWKLWWTEPKLYKLLMNGVCVPAVYRLFETGGGRKPWAGARHHIEKVNEHVRQLGETWKEEQSRKMKQV